MLPARVLDERLPNQKTISLARLLRLEPAQAEFGSIVHTIKQLLGLRTFMIFVYCISIIIEDVCLLAMLRHCLVLGNILRADGPSLGFNTKYCGFLAVL